MIVYAAIIPHPPFAIETIGKDKAKELRSTQDAITRVGEDLASLDVNTLVIITPHGERYETSLGIAFHDPYVSSLREFGDMSSTSSFKPDMRLIDSIQRSVRHAGTRSTMTTNEELDHGSAIPLLMLEQYIDSVKLVVLTPPVDAPKNLLSLGSTIREVIDSVDSKVAVLCSAELSHRLSELSPGGVHTGAEKFDKKLRIALADGNSLPLLKVTKDEIEDQHAQGIDAIRLFWGVLGETERTMEELSYEHPFGIGHLVMVAKLH